jgi:hypothetical protein
MTTRLGPGAGEEKRTEKLSKGLGDEDGAGEGVRTGISGALVTLA